MIKVSVPNKVIYDPEYYEEEESQYFFNITPGNYNLDFELCEYVLQNKEETHHVLISGYLKWDGCMNWKTNPSVMYHFCSPDDAFRLAKLFQFLDSLGKQHIINWMD